MSEVLEMTLNIGLARNDSDGLVSVDRLVMELKVFAAALAERGFELLPLVELHVPEGAEPFVVVKVVGRAHARYTAAVPAIWNLACWLHQDCIAVLCAGDPPRGALIGPKSDDWGDFNPAFFTVYGSGKEANTISL